MNATWTRDHDQRPVARFSSRQPFEWLSVEAAPVAVQKNPPPERGYRYRPHCGSRAVAVLLYVLLKVPVVSWHQVHLFTAVTTIAGKVMQLLADDKLTMEN